MAWNQPGGDGRDPWNDRGGQQGPPDLDEVLRKVQARLGQLFGGRPGRRPGSGGSGDGGGGSGGSGGRRIGGLGVGIVVALAFLAWGAYGIYVVDPCGGGSGAAFRAVCAHHGAGSALGSSLNRERGEGECAGHPQPGHRLSHARIQLHLGSARVADAHRGREHHRHPVRGPVPGQRPGPVPVPRRPSRS